MLETSSAAQWIYTQYQDRILKFSHENLPSFHAPAICVLTDQLLFPIRKKANSEKSYISQT